MRPRAVSGLFRCGVTIEVSSGRRHHSVKGTAVVGGGTLSGTPGMTSLTVRLRNEARPVTVTLHVDSPVVTRCWCVLVLTRSRLTWILPTPDALLDVDLRWDCARRGAPLQVEERHPTPPTATTTPAPPGRARGAGPSASSSQGRRKEYGEGKGQEGGEESGRTIVANTVSQKNSPRALSKNFKGVFLQKNLTLITSLSSIRPPLPWWERRRESR